MMQDCQEEIAIFLFINFKTGAFCEKSVNIIIVYAGAIKKVADFFKKVLDKSKARDYNSTIERQRRRKR